MFEPVASNSPATDPIAEAFRVADQLSPLPARAHEALQVLRAEVLLRWEQRTALSFRLQDLRDLAAKAGIADDSPLYGAIHDVTATAEAWMHPGTLSDAAQAHLARLKRDLAAVRDLSTADSALLDELRIVVGLGDRPGSLFERIHALVAGWQPMGDHPERTSCLLWHPSWAEPCVGTFVPEFNEWCDEERVPHPQPTYWRAMPPTPAAGFTPADMSDAAAQGFRDGAASVATPAAQASEVGTEWRHPDDLPPVAAGQYGWFWVAVRRAHNGRIYSFPAAYLNAMLLTDEYGDRGESSGNRYRHGPVDEDEGTFPATGWHDVKESAEYNGIYLPLLDKDELVAWREVPDYNDDAHSGRGEGL